MSQIQATILEVSKSHPEYLEDSLTIILLLKGDLIMHTFNTTKTYHEGDVIFINCKTVYYFEGNKTIVELVKIPTTLFAHYHYDYMRNITLIESLEENYSEKDIYYVYRDCIFIKDLLEAYDVSRNNNEQAKHLLEEKLTISLASEYTTTSSRIISEEQSKRYYRTLNYLNDNFQNKISLEEISAIEGLRKTSFAQSFKQIASCTFLDEATKIRLKYAQYLLTFTSLTNAEVSKQAGFSDMKYFYRDFQNHFKMTPNEYKKMLELYSQNYESHELTNSEAKPYLDAINNELAYIKIDTRLYQQYLLLKEMEFDKISLTNYEITLDLYDEANYLIFENERFLTWYGLNLILNLKAKYHMNLTVRLALNDVHNKEEEDELLHLLERTMYRMTKKEQRSVSFELLVKSKADLQRANTISIALYQACNIKCKTLII